MVFVLSCLIEPVDLDNDVNCVTSSFVGHWRYHSANGAVLDSMPDIEMIKIEDESCGDKIIDGRYFDIKSALGCTVGEASVLLDETGIKFYFSLESDYISDGRL